jgi:hypothetical protein
MALRLDDLSGVELQALLASDPATLPVEDQYAMRDFAERIGGMENAWLAANLIAQLERDHG